ncbi:DUF6119 family protein [Aurantiacibacter sp. D1-12]|uniref:DUF6119 family protein n=1 Tax=Aurantiacibacter sp. D1-12 TaxID=2993658 RepID=UPI00237C5D19|nr:DUF6119 family protein [Aurantiacibacter sp. D1-12]MDE1467974.1 TIGR04141 family sporadically distributed protein [Aurantiacibacter sp. D1-12]
MADQRKATVFRIKDGIDFEDAVDGFPNAFKTIPDIDGLSVWVWFDVIRSRKNAEQVPWLNFINSGLPDDPFEFESFNSFPRALVLLQRNLEDEVRRYALVFGMHADQPLDKEKIVHDFGLRVGMNICDSEGGIKRLQTAAHEAISLQTERQSSAGTTLGGFAVDLDAENIRTLSGIAKGEFRDQIENIRGKDQLSFLLPRESKLEWPTLSRYLDILETRYLSREYENTDFRDFDRFRLENDPEVIQRLDNIVAATIEERDFSRIHLAPPEFIEGDDPLFAYKPRGEAGLPPLYEDLRIDDLVNQPRRRMADLTADRLKGWPIYRYDPDRDYLGKFSNAYKCLVAEVDWEGRTFVLSGGRWREVSQELVDEISSYIEEEIDICERDYLVNDINIFDPVSRKNREAIFCRKTAVDNENVYCFDQANILIAGRAQYEVCDLFSLGGDLVQAKRYSSGSASISHLFLQARFYAHAFTSDQNTCADMRRWLGEDEREWNQGKLKQTFLDLIPETREEVEEQNFCVLFCILHTKPALGVGDLPFMARYELVKTHRFLTKDRKFQSGIAFLKVETGAGD